MKKMGPKLDRLSHSCRCQVGCSRTTGIFWGSTRLSCSRKVQKDSSAPHMMTCPVRSLMFSSFCTQQQPLAPGAAGLEQSAGLAGGGGAGVMAVRSWSGLPPHLAQQLCEKRAGKNQV